MDRQYTLCVLVPAHQYRSYVNNYHQQAHHQRLQQHQRQQYSEQQRSCKQPYQQEQIYENVVSQYRMRMCYHNDYENDEQIQRFYWEQCYRRDDTDATAYYYCEYVRIYCCWILNSSRAACVTRILMESVEVKFHVRRVTDHERIPRPLCHRRSVFPLSYFSYRNAFPILFERVPSNCCLSVSDLVMRVIDGIK